MLTYVRFVMFVLALGLGAMACRAQVRATAVVTEPELVLVDGDVWVVEHYNEPVFYTEGFYWRFYGGVWYRSTVHTGSWVQVSVVPAQVQRIERPEIYVNYTAPAGAQKRTGPPDHAPAHGVRGTEPGHAEGGGPPDHAPAHGVRGTEPGHDMHGGPMGGGHGGGPPDKPMKADKPGGGPPAGGPGGGPADKPMKADKPAGGPGGGGGADKPAKADKPAGGPGGGPSGGGGADKPAKADKPASEGPAKSAPADKPAKSGKDEDKGKKK